MLAEWIDHRSAIVVDIRPPQQFVDAHIPHSIALPLCRRWGEWAAALLPSDRPLVLLAAEPADCAIAAELAQRAPAVRFAAWLDPDPSPGSPMDAWLCQNRPADDLQTRKIRSISDELRRTKAIAPLILDVRDNAERVRLNIDPSVHTPLAELPAAFNFLPRDRPIATLCQSGVRSVIAAALLAREGFHRVTPIESGIERWAAQFPGDPALRIAH